MGSQPGFGHDTFISPCTWRYGSKAMRELWSEHRKRLLLRRVWTALAKAQHEAGLVTEEEVRDIEEHASDIDIVRASEIEAEIHHDLMAEIRTFAEQCPVGGRVIHLGATSMDVLDNVDALRIKEALGLIIEKTRALLVLLADLIDAHADLPSMAFTHLQPAEPTTVGYRLAQYGQDLLEDLKELTRVQAGIRGKGIKGAVGTSASYSELLKDSSMTPRDLEARVMKSLGLESYEAATQVYSRKQDWFTVNALAGTAATLYKTAFDLRILQSPLFGEWSEPFGKKQVGSSAMPFKRNPIRSEKINSLARYIASLPSTVWNNHAHCLLERTLDDSANRRIILPEAFLVLDEILESAVTVFKDLRIHQNALDRNMELYGVFASTERLLMELGRWGADRQEMHELIREHSIAAWRELQTTGVNPLKESLADDHRITSLIPRNRVLDLLNADAYIGDAPQRARSTARIIAEHLKR